MIYAFAWLVLLYSAFSFGAFPFARPAVSFWLLFLSLLFPPLFLALVTFAILSGPRVQIVTVARPRDRAVGLRRGRL